jgi:quercetin dioxygenase-like cupin family protein
MNTWDLLEVDAPDGVRDPVVVVEDDGARAVLVVLQPGQELGEHQVKENAWAVVVDGSVECESADGSRTELTRGTLTRWPRAERHALRSAEGARLLLILAPWPAADHFQHDEPR